MTQRDFSTDNPALFGTYLANDYNNAVYLNNLEQQELILSAFDNESRPVFLLLAATLRAMTPEYKAAFTKAYAPALYQELKADPMYNLADHPHQRRAKCVNSSLNRCFTNS